MQINKLMLVLVPVLLATGTLAAALNLPLLSIYIVSGVSQGVIANVTNITNPVSAQQPGTPSYTPLIVISIVVFAIGISMILYKRFIKHVTAPPPPPPVEESS